MMEISEEWFTLKAGQARDKSDGIWWIITILIHEEMDHLIRPEVLVIKEMKLADSTRNVVLWFN